MSDRRLKLLVVDDDDLILQSLRMMIPEQWRMIGVNALKDIPNENFSAALVDMHLSGNVQKRDGLEAVEFLHKRDPHLEIVAISGDLDRTLMEAGLRAGATRFLAKPLSPDEILFTLEKIEALVLLRTASLRKSGSGPQWIGQSSLSQAVQKQIAMLRAENGPILIEGESGTGKEVVATLLRSQDSDRPFVTVNAAAISENVFESEFFGHLRGAFTGADQNKMGLAEAAHGGDLFLDEIEALPLSQQAKLLRFLESGEIRRVGAKDTMRVQVRLIAATNQNLSQMVREGRFREDLLWRINGKKISLPALRDRPTDIRLLCEYFLSAEKPRRNKTLSDDALLALQNYNWPGNVRELKRVCEQLSLQSPLPIIRAQDVHALLQPASHNPQGQIIELSRGLDRLLTDYESHILQVAVETGKEIEELCQLLQISRSSLYKKLKDYNIETRS